MPRFTASELKKLHERDREFCERLVREHYVSVYSQLFRWLGNPEDAADLTQETFRKVWEKSTTYRGDSEFATWLYRIAQNTCMDWRRAQKKKPNIDPSFGGLSEVCGPNTDGLKRIRDAEENLALANLVRNLDERSQEVIELHYMKHQSIQQTANALGIKPGTAKWRLNRALHALRSMLSKNPSLRSRHNDG